MKKKFFLTTFMLILCAVGTLTACKDKHTHSYIESTTNPTCTEQGFTTYTCSCGDSYVENYVNALGHTETVDSAVAPTCTETGLTEGKHCSVCDEVIVAQQTVSSTGHSFGIYSKTQNATCTENAKETAYCEVCHKPDIRDIEGTALGHGNINTSNVCSVCNKETEYTKGMIYTAIEGGYELIDIGATKDTKIIVPKYYKNSPVLGIGTEVFYKKSYLSHIQLPDSITKIGDNAFAYCSGLTELTIPDSVKSFGSLILYGCSSLKKLTIPYLPAIVGEGTIYGLFGIKRTENWSSVPSDASSYIRYPYRYYQYIPLDTIILTKSTEIPTDAFRGCHYIKTISLPNSVKEIGDIAFGDCFNLTNFSIPKGVTHIGNHAFTGCTSLDSLVIPQTVTHIGPYAFTDTQLSTITFDDPSGWQKGVVSPMSGKWEGSAIDLSDPSANVILLTKTYSSDTLKKFN